MPNTIEGNSYAIFCILLVFSFFSIPLLTYNFIFRPLQSSDWNKVNSIECKRQINHTVACSHNLVGIMGTGVESKTFKLVKAEVKEYEEQTGEGDASKAYELYLTTDKQQIEIKDYGDDYEHAHSKQLLFTSLLNGKQQSLTFKYSDGLVKTLIIGGVLLLEILLIPLVAVALYICWYSRMRNTNSNF